MLLVLELLCSCLIGIKDPSLLKDMSALSYAPFVTFGKDPSKDDLPAYGKISNFGEWTWPPKEGMSVSCWIRIVNDHGINSPDKSKEKIQIKKSFGIKTFLNKKKLSLVKNAQKKALIKVFIKEKIPFREFRIKTNNEETLGKLFSYFMIETVIVGKLLNINPFDQPAVEQVKINTKRFLT